jgi:hypothetical protein
MRRRSFLALGFGWFPLRHRGDITMMGVPFRELRYKKSKRRYLFIHGNEQTARELLTNWMYTHSGIAYLVTGKTRNVEVMGAKLDPNRMFSRAGAEASLKRLNPGFGAEKIGPVLDYLDKHREELLKRLTPPAGGVTIALHNNSEGYNVNEELADSDKTSIPQPDKPHEFFLCTDVRDFELLAKSPYNVVLQNKKPRGDDGSLSRLAARRGFRYINLETTLGQFEEQIARLGWLDRHLDS